MHNYIKRWNYNDEMEEEHAQDMDVDEDMNVEEGMKVGSVSSDADTWFAWELRDTIAHQLWDGH